MAARTNNILQLTRHGEARMQQRGISKKMTNLILTYADCEVRRGGDVVGLSISRAGIRELRSDGVISSGEADSLGKIVLLYAYFSEQVVTVIKGGSRRAKGYRRDSRWKYAHHQRLANTVETGMPSQSLKIPGGGV